MQVMNDDRHGELVSYVLTKTVIYSEIGIQLKLETENTEKEAKLISCEKFCTHAVSIFIANSCVIKQGVTEPHYQKYCYFMPSCGKFMFCTIQLYELRSLAFDIKVSNW